MNKYLLDTNIISILYKNYTSYNSIKKQENLRENISKYNIDDLCSTTISKYESLNWIKNWKDTENKSKNEIIRKTIKFYSIIELLDLDEISIWRYKIIIEEQNKKWFCQKDHCDYFIASICLANDLILITDNIKDFEKIDWLNIENWTK